jgi:hypothetical protein
MPDFSGDSGQSAAGGTVDTEAAYGAKGAAPNPNLEENASTQDTTGTAVSGIGAALPGGSLTDPAAGAQSSSETGAPGSEYPVRPGTPGTYGWSQGTPDTEGVLGGGTPANFVPTNTALTGVLDTQAGGGGAFYSAYGTPPAYRAPAAYVAGSLKDTTLTDILGNQASAQPLNNATVMAAGTVDTSYYGAPAAPAALSAQTDTFTQTAATRPYYLSMDGVVPSTIVVRDVTKSTTLALTTNYTVTTAGNGPNTNVYITPVASAGYTQGDTLAVSYSYGTPQYFDSNLPAAQSITVTDTMYLSTIGQQLSQWGVTTAAASIVVFDVTTNQSLTYNTDYTVTKVVQPFTPGESWLPAANVPISYVITRIPSSTHSNNGDVITATYAYSSSVPLAPAMGSTTLQTDAGISFTAAPVALSKTGIVTSPGSFVVTDTTGANAGKVQVLNVDYTLVLSGSGSTLTYTIARLAGSTHSTSGDSVSVTYAYGNAAYFTSGPVVPMNRGVWVPWTPPAGITEVDYYQVLCSDLGTQYVPATGQPSFYGQPSPSGGGGFGNPAFQTDTFTTSFANAISPPPAPVPTTLGSGGTILAGTYGVIVSYTNAAGESVGSASGSVTTTGSTSTITIPSPPTVPGATGWYAYVTQLGGTIYTRQQAPGSPTALGTNLTLTAPPTSSGTNPLNAPTTGSTLSKTGIITAPNQLIVRDLTSTENDPMQPTGTVLEYGYDYTVTSIGNGPWQTYMVSRNPSSVNSAAGDTITVDYWWDTMGTTPLTAANDTITLVAGTAALHNSAVITPAASLIVIDTTTSKALAYNLDYTVSQTGEGPGETYSITRISGGPANVGATDTLHVYYLYGTTLGTLFTQGMTENIGPIYNPSGTTRSFQGYTFQVAAGNRAGLGPYSPVSDYAAPLNPNVNSSPTAHNYPGTLDPANTVNPIYLPNGSIKAGTGLGA